MKLNYKNQMILAISLVVVCYVLAVVFRNLLFRTIGLCLCGLLYAIHPVVQESEASNKDLKKLVRLVGIALIFIGLFTSV
ncbi:MAG: hypothetical protein IKY18_08510 [Oscillospiraceae bacterium]|nr:hypothetical protein [Oscillospiraceae bacterium]